VFYCTHECYENAVDKGDGEMIDEEANEEVLVEAVHERPGDDDAQLDTHDHVDVD